MAFCVSYFSVVTLMIYFLGWNWLFQSLSIAELKHFNCDLKRENATAIVIKLLKYITDSVSAAENRLKSSKC